MDYLDFPGYKVRLQTAVGCHSIMDLRTGLFLPILLCFVLSVRCQNSPSGDNEPRDDKDTAIVFRDRRGADVNKNVNKNVNVNHNSNINDNGNIEDEVHSYRRTITSIDRKPRGGRGGRKEPGSSNQNVNVNKNYNVNKIDLE